MGHERCDEARGSWWLAILCLLVLFPLCLVFVGPAARRRRRRAGLVEGLQQPTPAPPRYVGHYRVPPGDRPPSLNNPAHTPWRSVVVLRPTEGADVAPNTERTCLPFLEGTQVYGFQQRSAQHEGRSACFFTSHAHAGSLLNALPTPFAPNPTTDPDAVRVYVAPPAAAPPPPPAGNGGNSAP